MDGRVCGTGKHPGDKNGLCERRIQCTACVFSREAGCVENVGFSRLFTASQTPGSTNVP